MPDTLSKEEIEESTTIEQMLHQAEQQETSLIEYIKQHTSARR